MQAVYFSATSRLNRSAIILQAQTMFFRQAVLPDFFLHSLLTVLLRNCLLYTSSQNLVGTTEIAKFDDNAISQSYGLQVGDKIKSIDGMRVYSRCV